MAYERVNWENLPSTKTPVNADNLNKLNDVIDAKVDSAISSIEIGGRNLARLAYIKEFANTLNRDGYIFTGYAGAGAGIQFQKSDFNWELNQYYVLSFKFQNLTKDKDLTEIGGHSLAFRTEAIYINGKLIKNQWVSKNTIPASKGEQTCIVILQYTTPSESDPNLYIQPQRGNYHSSNDLLIKFWDIKIERGNKATDWTPAPEDIYNNIYPIGSIYMSVNSTNPANLFGGTWEQIKDRFLLACGSTYNAGATGGEATHTLTINEMPSHRHQLTANGDGPSLYPDWGKTSGWGVPSKHLDGNGGIVSSALTGGGQAHNNMPPYLAVYMWKRIT